MASKGKSEQKRISDLENALGRVAADLETISKQLEISGGAGTVFAPILPVAPLLRPELLAPLAGAVFALTPLPRTITAGSGKCQCKDTANPPTKDRRTVHNFPANATIACQVENVGDCSSVEIKVMRGAVEVATSPLVAPGNAGSLGPVAVLANDTVVVLCVGTSTTAGSCKFNWQINLA
jgi:hypothetical protein